MQKRDSIRVRNSVFSSFVINYSHFKRCFKNQRMLFDGPMPLEQIPAADLLKTLLCFEISVDVYAVCVFQVVL